MSSGNNNINVDLTPPLFTIGLRVVNDSSLLDEAQEEWYFRPVNLHHRNYKHFQTTVQLVLGSNLRVVVLVSDGSYHILGNCNMDRFANVDFLVFPTSTHYFLAPVHPTDATALGAKRAIRHRLRNNEV